MRWVCDVIIWCLLSRTENSHSYSNLTSLMLEMSLSPWFHSMLTPMSSDRQRALITAMAKMLWQAGGNKHATVALWVWNLYTIPPGLEGYSHCRKLRFGYTVQGRARQPSPRGSHLSALPFSLSPMVGRWETLVTRLVRYCALWVHLKMSKQLLDPLAKKLNLFCLLRDWQLRQWLSLTQTRIVWKFTLSLFPCIKWIPLGLFLRLTFPSLIFESPTLSTKNNLETSRLVLVNSIMSGEPRSLHKMSLKSKETP